MAAKGQYLERPALVKVQDDLVLEGLWHRGNRSPPLLILSPAPHEGGSMDHVLAAELAWAAARAGHPVLRFNFRGVGASQGTRGGARTQVEDAEAALRLLEESSELGAVVVSLFGSALIARSLIALHPTVRGLAFVEPPDTEIPELALLTVPFQVVVGERSPHAKAALAAAVSEAGGWLEIVPGADRTFQKNLPRVGEALTAWLPRCSPPTADG